MKVLSAIWSTAVVMFLLLVLAPMGVLPVFVEIVR